VCFSSHCTALPALRPDGLSCLITTVVLDAWLAEHLPKLGEKLQKGLKDGLAIAASRTQTVWPVVELLVSDDAPQFNWLTAELALCWIHEFRHYNKLIPHLPSHRQLAGELQGEFLEGVPETGGLPATSHSQGGRRFEG
jgi:hypothetical protein